MAPTEIEVSDLGYAVGGTEILKDVDILIRGGKITAVAGPSGAGKSTLLRAINRLIEPTSGEIYLDGVPTSNLDPLELRRRVGMVFQVPALFGGSVEGRSGKGVQNRASGCSVVRGRRSHLGEGPPARRSRGSGACRG